MLFQRVQFLLAAAFSLLLSGCAASIPSESRPTPDVSGLWVGGSRAACGPHGRKLGRCVAEQIISFRLTQENSTVGGFYKCAYGNRNCLGMNDRGEVAHGEVRATMLSMRVMMDDGSSCLFSARPQIGEMHGQYSCLQGGGLLEKGDWYVQRAY